MATRMEADMSDRFFNLDRDMNDSVSNKPSNQLGSVFDIWKRDMLPIVLLHVVVNVDHVLLCNVKSPLPPDLSHILIYALMNRVSIGSDNGLSPIRRQAIA